MVGSSTPIPSDVRDLRQAARDDVTKIDILTDLPHRIIDILISSIS